MPDQQPAHEQLVDFREARDSDRRKGRLIGGVRGSETILVAEDEEVLRALIQVILGRLGYAVLLAPNAVAALELARTRPIDLLISDVVMPGRSGFELAQAVREVQPATPVLLMSGYAPDALEPRGLASGDDVLQKPFTPDSLGRTVRRMLENRRV